jgi:MFS family permease
MDPAWLEVVRERSQFLFLQYWSRSDWELAARPLLCLALSALVLPADRGRRLCLAALLVGASGLAVALIAGTIGPVAVLLQGQAWRWMWVTSFVAVLLVVPTAFAVWREPRGGPLCAVLMVMAWTFPEIDGCEPAAAALALFVLRHHLSPRTGRHLRWAAAAIGAIVVAWISAHAWTYLDGPVPESGREALLIARVREIFGLGIPGALVAAALWYWMDRTRSPYPALGVAVAMLAAAILVMPGSVKQMDATGMPAEIAEFSDWRDAIPPDGNVLILPTRKSAAFFWFTLDRPSYLTVDQSSGVVFSALTAQEVRRRSEVLLPVTPPDWRIFTQLAREQADRDRGVKPRDEKPPPLTAQKLAAICRDPQLGFVIAKEDLGFGGLRHTHPGAFKDWLLYDCGRVRAAGST